MSLAVISDGKVVQSIQSPTHDDTLHITSAKRNTASGVKGIDASLNLYPKLVNADVDDAAAIAYSKLALLNSILTSDILSTEFNVANKLLKLDASALTPLNQIPSTLTGKDADTVDTYHATSLEKTANKDANPGYPGIVGNQRIPIRIRNILYGVTPTAPGTWDYAPPNLGRTTDGDLSNVSQGETLQTADDTTYFQWDLGAQYDIAILAIRLYMYSVAGASTCTVKIKTSPDGAAWTTQKTFTTTLGTLQRGNFAVFNLAGVQYIRATVYSASGSVVAILGINEIYTIFAYTTSTFGIFDEV